MFSIEEIYGVDRKTYCEMTGTDMEEIVIRLRKEVTVLEVNLAKVREAYRSGGDTTNQEQRNRARLLMAIESKISRKRAKIQDIERFSELM